MPAITKEPCTPHEDFLQTDTSTRFRCTVALPQRTSLISSTEHGPGTISTLRSLRLSSHLSTYLTVHFPKSPNPPSTLHHYLHQRNGQFPQTSIHRSHSHLRTILITNANVSDGPTTPQLQMRILTWISNIIPLLYLVKQVSYWVHDHHHTIRSFPPQVTLLPAPPNSSGTLPTP